MEKTIRSTSLRAVLLTLIALTCQLGCGSAIEVPARQLGSIALSLSLAADQCGVVKVTATVEAPDLKGPIGPVPLTVGAEKATGVLNDIPAGTQRKVSVVATNATNLAVYQGSAFVDVQKDEETKVDITLYRSHKNCPAQVVAPITGSGALNISGSLNNDFLAFSPQGTQMDDQGVVYFLDGANRAVRRYDISASKFLEPFDVPVDSTLMATAPAGDTVYVAYSGNRIDAIDVATGKRTFFVATPERISSMLVVGSYLFSIDASGAWNSHRLFDRKTGICKSTVDWRNAAEGLAFSSRLSRVFSLTAGVSPNDIEFEPIDLEKGAFGQNKDSPYHGDFSLHGPVKLFPGEDRVAVGSGVVFRTEDLTYDSSMGMSFSDLAFHGDHLFVLNGDRVNSIVTKLNQRYEDLGEIVFAGTPIALFIHGDSLAVVTDVSGSIRVNTQSLR